MFTPYCIKPAVSIGSLNNIVEFYDLEPTAKLLGFRKGFCGLQRRAGKSDIGQTVGAIAVTYMPKRDRSLIIVATRILKIIKPIVLNIKPTDKLPIRAFKTNPITTRLTIGVGKNPYRTV